GRVVVAVARDGDRERRVGDHLVAGAVQLERQRAGRVEAAGDRGPVLDRDVPGRDRAGGLRGGGGQGRAGLADGECLVGDGRGGGGVLLGSRRKDTTEWYVPGGRLTAVAGVSKLPLADTAVENDVPAIAALLESSSTKLRVPSPVYPDPPDSVARSWTVTGPAV